MLIDKIDLLPSNQLSDFLNSVSMFFSVNQWLSIGIVLIYIFLILFILYYFKRDSNSKKKALVIGAGGVSPSVILSIQKLKLNMIILILV